MDRPVVGAILTRPFSQGSFADGDTAAIGRDAQVRAGSDSSLKPGSVVLRAGYQSVTELVFDVAVIGSCRQGEMSGLGQRQFDIPGPGVNSDLAERQAARIEIDIAFVNRQVKGFRKAVDGYISRFRRQPDGPDHIADIEASSSKRHLAGKLLDVDLSTHALNPNRVCNIAQGEGAVVVAFNRDLSGNVRQFDIAAPAADGDRAFDVGAGDTAATVGVQVDASRQILQAHLSVLTAEIHIAGDGRNLEIPGPSSGLDACPARDGNLQIRSDLGVPAGLVLIAAYVDGVAFDEERNRSLIACPLRLAAIESADHLSAVDYHLPAVIALRFSQCLENFQSRCEGSFRRFSPLARR